jgi:tetratricopeptide (TPR) repeat protein
VQFGMTGTPSDWPVDRRGRSLSEDTLEQQAAGLIDRGQTTEAEQLLDKVLAKRLEALGAYPKLLATTLADHALFSRALGLFKRAQGCLQQALSVFQQANQPTPAVLYQELGENALDIGAFAEAEQHLRRAWEQYEQQPDGAMEPLAKVAGQLGIALIRQNQWEAATPWFETAVEYLQHAPVSDDQPERLSEALCRLKASYTHTGRTTEAAHVAQQIEALGFPDVPPFGDVA